MNYMKSNTLLWGVLLTVGVVGVIVFMLLNKGKDTSIQSGKIAPTVSTIQTQPPEQKIYSLDTVSTHNTSLDCWMIIDGKVYDVTSYIPDHPNTDIEKGCGKEATTLFNEVRKHQGEAASLLNQYEIGTEQN